MQDETFCFAPPQSGQHAVPGSLPDVAARGSGAVPTARPAPRVGGRGIVIGLILVVPLWALIFLVIFR